MRTDIGRFEINGRGTERAISRSKAIRHPFSVRSFTIFFLNGRPLNGPFMGSFFLTHTVGVNKKFPRSARTTGARSKTTGSEWALNGNRTDVERNGPFRFFPRSVPFSSSTSWTVFERYCLQQTRTVLQQGDGVVSRSKAC